MQCYQTYSFGKINLFLDVLEKRVDGYHAIDSLFLPINWADVLLLKPSEVFEWVCSDTNLQEQSFENLNFHKVMMLLKPYQRNSNMFRLSLLKNVPYQAGLGIASSNAVSFMTLLNHFWDCRLEKEDLIQLSYQVGSDCAFFFQHQVARVQGRGEQVASLGNLPGVYPFLILKSREVSISTQEAYNKIEKQNYYRQYSHLSKMLDQTTNIWEWDLLCKFVHNSFDDILSPMIKEIEMYKSIFTRENVIIQMSGSGSAFFLIFRTKKEADSFSQEKFVFLQKKFDFYWGLI